VKLKSGWDCWKLFLVIKFQHNTQQARHNTLISFGKLMLSYFHANHLFLFSSHLVATLFTSLQVSFSSRFVGKFVSHI